MQKLVALAALFTLSFALRAGEPAGQLFEPLLPFAPLLKTWKGEFVGSTPEKPKYDVARWERILNGKGIRVLHSVNDGAYGGETIIYWNVKQKSLAYWYFTTAGFRTEGTMKFEKDSWVSHETVVDNPDGVTEVRAATRLLPDGRLHMKSEYLRKGTWVKGTERFYKEAPEAKVIFR